MQSTEKSFYALKALKISAIAILSVVLVEFIIGSAVGSLAILSDSAHALLDALSAIILFVATRASLKPPDEEHMYGHEKMESLGSLIGGLILIGVAVLLMLAAVPRFFANKSYIVAEFEFAGFIAVGYTFIIDLFRVGTMRKAEHGESSTVKVGFYHALADMGSTIIAFLGFGLATVGFYYGDALASIVLSFMITYLSVKLIWSSGMELSDAISKDVVEKIRKEIMNVRGIRKCESLRVRKAGGKTFVEATVHVPEFMSLEEAHNLASKTEAKIKESLGNADATIHIEPLKKELQIESVIKEIAAEIDSVKETHEINAVYTGGRLYITLHVRVNPELSVHEAHEIAEKIESKLSDKISDVENVTVHVEPFDAKIQKGSAVDEKEIRKVIYKTVEGPSQALQCKRILTYVANKKRYINIDCSFTSQIEVKLAHEIASQIERNVKKQFAETIVTVHMEPD